MRKVPITYRLVVILLGVKMRWWTKAASSPSEWGKVKGLAPRETYLEIRPGDHPIGLDHRKSPLMLPVVSVYRRRSS